MKSFSSIIRVTIVFVALLFVGCDNMTVKSGDGSEKVEGNGKLKLENREISSFNKIELTGVFNVFLSQKNKESLKIEADENILPLILTSVENGVLTIKWKDNSTISKMKKINIYISFVDISKLSTDGVGMMDCFGKLKLKDLELDLKGAGKTRLNLESDKLSINSEMVGALILEGAAKDVHVKHNGIGVLEAFGLKAEKLNLDSDGVGKAEVFASKELIIDAKGLCGVKYRGNPAIKNITSEGLGEIVGEN